MNVVCGQQHTQCLFQLNSSLYVFIPSLSLCCCYMWISPWKSIIEASSHLIIFSLQSTETIKDCLAQHSCVAITISEHMTLCHVSTQGQPKWRSQDKTIILLTVYYWAWFVMKQMCAINMLYWPSMCTHTRKLTPRSDSRVLEAPEFDHHWSFELFVFTILYVLITFFVGCMFFFSSFFPRCEDM